MYSTRAPKTKTETTVINTASEPGIGLLPFERKVLICPRPLRTHNKPNTVRTRRTHPARKGMLYIRRLEPRRRNSYKPLSRRRLEGCRAPRAKGIFKFTGLAVDMPANAVNIVSEVETRKVK